MKTTYFLEIVQNYYMHPIINKETGENKIVYFEVDVNDFDEAIDLAKCKLNFDFEMETILDFYSDEFFCIWDFHRLLNYNQFLSSIGKDCSVILIDGTIINK
jgi:hypothetical protein